MPLPLDETRDVIRFTATDKGQLLDMLDSAVSKVETSAVRGGKHGVLVIRHDYASFSVVVSPDVPFGITLEREDLFGGTSNFPAPGNQNT